MVTGQRNAAKKSTSAAAELPRRKRQGAPEGKRQRKGDKAWILIVDDHEVLRDGMRLMIEHQPDLAVCGEASDETTAIRQFRSLRPDLVVVDLSLRAGNGIELIKRIKAIEPGARVVVYSMHDERIYAERALRAGAMAYVTKQKPAHDMLKAIRRVLAGKMHFSDEMMQRLLERAAGQESLTPSTPVESLSDRELEVFEMIGRGLTTKAIAEQLHLSPRTVDTYRERLKNKLGLANAAELHHRAAQWAIKGA
jgi:DNA-binding NarL/FixJ family response regulator